MGAVQNEVRAGSLLLRLETHPPERREPLGGTPILVRDGKRWAWGGPGSFVTAPFGGGRDTGISAIFLSVTVVPAPKAKEAWQ